MNEAVRYLNFRASSLSGNSFDASSDDYSSISPGLIWSTQIELYRPHLEKVHPNDCALLCPFEISRVMVITSRLCCNSKAGTFF